MRVWKPATAAVVAAVAVIALAASGSSSKSGSGGGTTASTAAKGTSAPTAPTPTTVPTRQVSGKATTLGAGNFTVGTDVVPGLYDVTPGAGQSGNFIVQGTDEYDEVLGNASGLGVTKARVKLQSGDKVQISGLSTVTFTPVSSPYVTAYAPATLYAGTWTVGQDIGAGRYVATPGAGQSGNFIVEAEGVDEVLGGSNGLGVPSVTVDLHKGDVITISGLSTVTMTPKS
jgi:hypothetical protein